MKVWVAMHHCLVISDQDGIDSRQWSCCSRTFSIESRLIVYTASLQRHQSYNVSLYGDSSHCIEAKILVDGNDRPCWPPHPACF